MAAHGEPGVHSRAAIARIPAIAAELIDSGATAASQMAHILGNSQRIIVTGTGSSYHVSCFGEHLLRFAGRAAWAEPASTFVTYPRPLAATDGLIAISHRGNKSYTVAALERAIGASLPTILITGNPTRYQGPAPSLIVPAIEQEQASMHTKSLTAASVQLALLAVELAGPDHLDAKQALQRGLAALPAALHATLDSPALVSTIARDVAQTTARIFVAGSGPNFATAKEGALKVKEGAYRTAEGFLLEEAIHGPFVGFEAGDLLVLVAPSGPSAARAQEFGSAMRSIGMRTWIIGAAGTAEPTYHTPLPDLPEVLTPIVVSALMAQFALVLAMEIGTDPDGFRLEHAAYADAYHALTL
jgi:glucosamine--fructose-6-phosphate aminotransferase (isomerizing)